MGLETHTGDGAVVVVGTKDHRLISSNAMVVVSAKAQNKRQSGGGRRKRPSALIVGVGGIIGGWQRLPVGEDGCP